MSILHSPLFLGIFFTAPIWGLLLATAISTYLGPKSIFIRAAGTALQFVSTIPIVVAITIFTEGSYDAAEHWSEMFFNITNLIALLSSISGPFIIAFMYPNSKMGHKDFLINSLFAGLFSIICWIVILFVGFVLWEIIRVLANSISIVTRQ